MERKNRKKRHVIMLAANAAKLEKKNNLVGKRMPAERKNPVKRKNLVGKKRLVQTESPVHGEESVKDDESDDKEAEDDLPKEEEKVIREKLTLRWEQVDWKAKGNLERRARTLMKKPGHRGRGRL
jgi:hypothetical protein